MQIGGAHVLVLAKAPVAGRVKTRLCPPLTPAQAATVAEAALADTLDAVARCGASRRVLALDGEPGVWLPPGFTVVGQRGRTFNERLAAAWSDAGGPGVQIGMDTPQVSAELLDECLARTMAGDVGATLGPAEDGGWWALGLAAAPTTDVFAGVPMSDPTTGRAQRDTLERIGYRVGDLPVLRDIDTAEDLAAVAALAPAGRLAAAWRRIGMPSTRG